MHAIPPRICLRYVWILVSLRSIIKRFFSRQLDWIPGPKSTWFNSLHCYHALTNCKSITYTHEDLQRTEIPLDWLLKSKSRLTFLGMYKYCTFNGLLTSPPTLLWREVIGLSLSVKPSDPMCSRGNSAYPHRDEVCNQRSRYKKQY